MASCKMLLFSALLLGWLGAQSFAGPAGNKKQQGKKQQGKSLGQEDGEGSDGTNPKARDAAATYVQWGDHNMANVQTQMDTHFVKKKKEGTAIEKYGDKSRAENEELQQKTEDSQDKALQAGMQWTDKEVQDAETNLLKDGKGTGEKGSNDEGQVEAEEESGDEGGEDGAEGGGEDDTEDPGNTEGQSGRSMKGKGKDKSQSGRGMKGKGKDTSQSGRGIGKGNKG